MKEDLKSKILEDHANGIILADIANKYDISASDLVDLIIDDSTHDEKCAIPPVGNNNASNTEVQDDTTTESISKESLVYGYSQTPNDIFMDMIIFGKDLQFVCTKYDMSEGDIGVVLEEIYKELSDRVIPMDDIKEAIKRICAEVYLARFN